MARSSSFSSFRPGGQGMVFLFCFLLASAIWVINALSKTYAATYSIHVVTSAVESSGQNVNVSLRGSGFSLLRLYYRINNARIEKYTPKQLSTHELVDSLISDLKSSVQIIRTEPSQISGIFSDDFRVKKLPVKSKVSVSYANQFGSLLPVMHEPDSVEVSGPADKIDTIKFIETLPLKVSDLKEPLFRSVRLKQPDHDVVLSRAYVWMYIRAERYTEKQLDVAVTVNNSRYKAMPDEVQLTFNIPLSQYNKVKPEHFSVVANATNRMDEKNYPLKLTKKPNFIRNVKIHPETVSLLIFE